MTVTHKTEFRKLGQDERIRLCDFHSLDDGKNLEPIRSEESVGDLPINFAEDRTFWRVIRSQQI